MHPPEKRAQQLADSLCPPTAQAADRYALERILRNRNRKPAGYAAVAAAAAMTPSPVRSLPSPCLSSCLSTANRRILPTKAPCCGRARVVLTASVAISIALH